MEKLEIDLDEVLSSLIPSEAFKAAMNHVLNGPNRNAYTKPLPSRPLMFWTRSDYGILKEYTRLYPETIHKIVTLPWAEVDHIADKLTLELREIAERVMLKRQTETLNFIKDKSIWKIDNSVDFETSKYFQDNKYTTSEPDNLHYVPDWAPGAEGYDTLMGYTGYDGYFTEPWVNWSLMEDCNYQQMLRDEVPLAEETGIHNFVEFKSPFLPEYEGIVNEATFLDCDDDFAAVPAGSGHPSGPMIPDWTDLALYNYNCYSHYYQMYADLESRMFMDNAVMTGLDFESNHFIPMRHPPLIPTPVHQSTIPTRHSPLIPTPLHKSTSIPIHQSMSIPVKKSTPISTTIHESYSFPVRRPSSITTPVNEFNSIPVRRANSIPPEIHRSTRPFPPLKCSPILVEYPPYITMPSSAEVEDTNEFSDYMESLSLSSISDTPLSTPSLSPVLTRTTTPEFVEAAIEVTDPNIEAARLYETYMAVYAEGLSGLKNNNTLTEDSSIDSDNSEGKTMNNVFTSTSGRNNICESAISNADRETVPKNFYFDTEKMSRNISVDTEEVPRNAYTDVETAARNSYNPYDVYTETTNTFACANLRSPFRNIDGAYPSTNFDYGRSAHIYGAYTDSNNFYSMQGNNVSEKSNSFGPGTAFRSKGDCPIPENPYRKKLGNVYRNPYTNNSGNVNHYPGPEHNAYDIYTKNLLAYASSLNEAYVNRMGGASADRLRNVNTNGDLKDAYTQHEDSSIDTSLAYAFSKLTNIDTGTNTNPSGIDTDLTSMNLSNIDTGAHSNAFSRFDNTKTNNYTISTDNNVSISSNSYYDQNNTRFGSIDTSISSNGQTVIGNNTGPNFLTPVAGPSSATNTRIVYSNNGTRQVYRKSNNIYTKFYKKTKANYNRTFPPLSFGQNRTNGADEDVTSSSDESGADEGPIIEIRGVRNAKYMVTKKGTKREFLCVFCAKQGEAEEVFKSHPIRVNGIVMCPFLRNHVCALCKATGDNAHTIKYCPQNKRGFFAMKAMERSATTEAEIEAAAAVSRRISMDDYSAYKRFQAAAADGPQPSSAPEAILTPPSTARGPGAPSKFHFRPKHQRRGVQDENTNPNPTNPFTGKFVKVNSSKKNNNYGGESQSHQRSRFGKSLNGNYVKFH